MYTWGQRPGPPRMKEQGVRIEGVSVPRLAVTDANDCVA